MCESHVCVNNPWCGSHVCGGGKIDYLVPIDEGCRFIVQIDE